MQKSIWEEEQLPQYPCLDENLETEVLVIGGGICGILCAYFLSKTFHVTLVEGKRIACQRTKNTTAVITALQDIYYKDIIKRQGKLAAKQYLEANLEAIKIYEELANAYEFDFIKVPSYKYFKNQQELLMEEFSAIQSLGYQPTIEDNYALCFPDMAQMNPIKFIKNLIKNFKIYENTQIVKLKKQNAYTIKHKISAKYIVVATGYPFLKLKGAYPLKLTQNKSYVAVVKDVEKKMDFNAIGCETGDLYFRTCGSNLIIGGNDQKTGQSLGGFSPLLQHILKHYPENDISYLWVNQDCVSADGLPYIGKYFKKENVYVATGFNLWGMTGSMIAAQMITDQILNNPNPYTFLFNPYRPNPLFPLIKNSFTAIKNFVLPKKRCSHLGCALFYNTEEDVYECPCHGTKYDVTGHILYNPAKYKEK